VIIGAGVSKILFSQFGLPGSIFVSLGETILLVCFAAAATRIPKLEKLVGFIFTIAAANFAWRVAIPWIEASNVFRSFSDQWSWGAQFFLSRTLRTFGAVLMIATLLGSGIRARDLFLRVGNWRAPVKAPPFFFFKREISWAGLAFIVFLLFGVFLAWFLICTLHPQLGRLHLFVAMLPWAIATSAVNAANEEFQFRSVLLARLHNVVSPNQAVLLAGGFFGLCHYFGQPAGWGGVILAAIAGSVWAKSMIETRGFTWAFLIHFVQDFVIFAFLVMANTSFPKS
jgi:membrane protease YdiL (CAAX protease family)